MNEQIYGILEIISDVADRPVEELHEDDDLLTDVGLSSFEIIQLIAAIEQKYNIRIPTRSLASFTTPKSIADYLNEVKK